MVMSKSSQQVSVFWQAMLPTFSGDCGAYKPEPALVILRRSDTGYPEGRCA